MTISVQGRSRRAELGDFLKARRAQVSPADVGLPPGPRRRTPGLRREEVAQLAGVGVTWYTWLEQGRPINVSSQVLDAVARTLGLSPPERTHLYRLTESTPVRSAPESCPDESTLVEILMALDPLPAVISNARFDILFEELWSRHEVAACQPRPRHVVHPIAGELHLTVTEMTLPAYPDLRLFVETPADPQTRTRLSLATQPPPPNA